MDKGYLEEYITDDEFKELVAPFSLPQKFAVAVSGGCDSVALLILAQRFALAHGLSCVGLTVNHGLREHSTQEALQVQAFAQKLGVTHHILTWKHKTFLNSKIQEQARLARYDLLWEFCVGNHISCLLTGHHQGDQLETFFMRLNHRSGLKGLCAMKAIVPSRDGFLIRPFLSIPKERLKQTVIYYEGEWVEDPSNEKHTFERVRIRNFLTAGAQEGYVCSQNMCDSIDKLQKAQQFIDSCVASFFEHDKPDYFCLEKFRTTHTYLQQCIIKHCLRTLTTKDYISTDKAIFALCEKLRLASFKRATLGGLLFVKQDKLYVRIKPEEKRQKRIK